MAYDELLADRIRNQFTALKTVFDEKKMFGGICFLVDDKMCVGVVKETLMLRIDPEEAEKIKQIDGVRDMDFTNRPMKGFLYVDPEGMEQEEELLYFLTKALEYNPKAKSSKKKKKS